MFKTYYTYIMSNKNNTVLYIGVTNDLKRRVEEHKSGLIPGFTRKYNCHKLVHYETFSDINQAIEREKTLKGWIRKRKDELINMHNPEREDLYNRFFADAQNDNIKMQSTYSG